MVGISADPRQATEQSRSVRPPSEAVSSTQREVDFSQIPLGNISFSPSLLAEAGFPDRSDAQRIFSSQFRSPSTTTEEITSPSSNQTVTTDTIKQPLNQERLSQEQPFTTTQARPTDPQNRQILEPSSVAPGRILRMPPDGSL
jgi:hypothetical protein